MKKIIIIAYSTIATLAALFFGYKFFYHRVVGSSRDNVVAYADGTAEIIVNDNVPDQVAHTYRLKTKAIWNQDLKTFTPPAIQMVGGAWQRMVYIYDDSDQSCFSNIFYIDRVHKNFKQFKTGYCIIGTLDQHDITHFLAMTPKFDELVVGTYENGQVVAGTKIPGPLIFDHAASNWELTKLAFAAGSCNNDSTSTVKILIWNLEKGVLEDKTPKNFACGSMRTIFYNHDNDSFVLEIDKGASGTKDIVL